MAFLAGLTVLICIGSLAISERVSYAGHRVLTVTPKTNEELEFLHGLISKYDVDLWNEPRFVNHSVMMRLEPKLVKPVTEFLVKNYIEYFVAFHDLQKIIDEERAQHAPSNVSRYEDLDLGKYHPLKEVNEFIWNINYKNPAIARDRHYGQSYYLQPMYLMQISSGDLWSGTKPVIFIECGAHAREWSSVAACLYLINELIDQYEEDDLITSLVDKYEFIIVPVANPDGYVYSWEKDRLWRKTRRVGLTDWLEKCPGIDINRNFDIHHCGVGASKEVCDDTYCGPEPSSEFETRELEAEMKILGSRLKAYFSIHAYSQLWMTPYGYSKKLPPNYDELLRVANAGTKALSRKYGTQYKVGTVANTKGEASGTSMDFAYEKKNAKMAFEVHLRDTGRYGYFLPEELILPTCEEFTEGILAAIAAM